METEMQESALGQRPGNRFDLGKAVLSSVKGGVETGDLPQAGPNPLDRIDAGETQRLMARRQRHQGFQLGSQVGIDAGGPDVVSATVHDPVTGCPGVEARNGSQPRQKPSDD